MHLDGTGERGERREATWRPEDVHLEGTEERGERRHGGPKMCRFGLWLGLGLGGEGVVYMGTCIDFCC